MVFYRRPATLVRIGSFTGNLESAIKKYHENLDKIEHEEEIVSQYAVFNKIEPYLLLFMFAPKKHGLFHKLRYKVVLTVTSYSDEVNQNTANIFERETSIKLRQHVSWREKGNYNHLNNIIGLIEEDPDRIMLTLAGKLPRPKR